MVHQQNFVLLCLAVITACTVAQRDATLQEGAVGKEVTEAVLRKLKLSNIFIQDHSFLIRLAYTETRFGENINISLPFQGGIWAVNETFYEATKYPNLTSEHALIAQKFQINWNKTEWRDLRKPLYSGIAAALFFNFGIPQGISSQAQYWWDHYRLYGHTGHFISDVEQLQGESKCRGKFDLAIVLDSSQSRGESNYRLATNFIADLIESFSRDFTRIGMVVYSSVTEVIFKVNNTNTITQLAEMSRNAPYLNGNRQTDKGILEAVKLLQEVDNSEGIPKIITVFTVGKSNGAPLAEAIELMRNNSIKPLSIGIGADLDKDELDLIALTDPASVFMIEDFNALKDFLQQLTSVVCEISQAPKLNTEYHDSLMQNETRIYRIESPPEGITITVDSTKGDTKGYWSYSVPVPTEAINDGTIIGSTYVSRRQSDEEDEEDVLNNIYITIQGVAKSNNYTLKMTAGSQADNGAAIVSIATAIVAVVTSLHILFLL